MGDVIGTILSGLVAFCTGHTHEIGLRCVGITMHRAVEWTPLRVTESWLYTADDIDRQEYPHEPLHEP